MQTSSQVRWKDEIALVWSSEKTGEPKAGSFGCPGHPGPAKRLHLLAQAGFRSPTLAADTGFNLVLAAIR